VKSEIVYIIIILGLICSCSRNDCMYHGYYGNGVLFEEGKLLNGKKEGLYPVVGASFSPRSCGTPTAMYIG